ncbi:hypothetical protein [Vagococcus fluvialis]|nr:hypothetical protein QDW48_13830 [Vagococcus fluvialis]
MKISIESRKGEAFLFESIIAILIPIISLITAIVNLIKAIVESKKEQKK